MSRVINNLAPPRPRPKRSAAAVEAKEGSGHALSRRDRRAIAAQQRATKKPKG